MRKYSFPLKPAHDFELDGNPAEFASGHPREWGWESEAIDYRQGTKGDTKTAYVRYNSALSSDQKLLAISSNGGRILIYNVASKELGSVLEGAGPLAFRPTQVPKKPGYTLVSGMSYDGSRGAIPEYRLILWDLDHHGRLLDDEESIDAAAFAAKAITVILPELVPEHEWTEEFVQPSSLQADVEKALGQVAADHRRRHNTILNNAILGNFGSAAFSNDGRLLLYHYQNGTTQQGMRDPDKLPQVVVYDIDAGKELQCLSGHTDAIMWSATSPNNEYVASVSWDGTLRMYSLSAGELAWATDNSGGQSWAGGFTPDSKHIVWSSNRGRVIQVHAVADGEKVSTFQEKLDDWCRDFVWHPAGQQLVFCVGKHAYIWRPFDGPDGTITQHYVLDDSKDWLRMASVQLISWMDEGRLLSLQFSEGTKLVYDTQTNAKEVFMRPKGVETSWSRGFYGVLKGDDEGKFYLTVDGDGKVRYWRTSIPAFPSWWEKEKEVKETAIDSKKMYPETGKYVKITKVPNKEARQIDEGQSS